MLREESRQGRWRPSVPTYIWFWVRKHIRKHSLHNKRISAHPDVEVEGCCHFSLRHHRKPVLDSLSTFFIWKRWGFFFNFWDWVMHFFFALYSIVSMQQRYSIIFFLNFDLFFGKEKEVFVNLAISILDFSKILKIETKINNLRK